MNYRADIDGLRAIAVLSVLMFHYGVTTVAGGFVGVDVFFVISGFLITRNLHDEISTHGLSLVGFYNRRIRRIVPALLVVLVASVAIAYCLLMPGDYAALGESASYAAVGAGNIYFFMHTNYFDREAALQPLLHLWSLGVEEQFYLVWPILLALFMQTRCLARFAPRLLVLLVLAASLTLSVYVIRTDQKSAFYLPHLRAWELAAGALLVFLPPIRSRIISELVGPLGLALISYSLFSLTEKELFPGLNAIPAVLGSALLLLPRTKNATAWVLALLPMRFVGLISYSLYLWHWPILVFFRYYANGDMPNYVEAGVLAAVALALATLSWYLIERPIRRSKLKPVAMTASGLLAVAVVVTVGVFVLRSRGVESRLAGNDRAMSSLAEMWKWDCRYIIIPELNGAFCTFGADWEFASSRALIWGDSHAQHMGPIIEAADRDPNWSFLIVAPCPVSLGGAVRRSQPEDPEDPDYVLQCVDLRRRGLEMLRTYPEIKLVIMSSSWGGLARVVAQDGSLPNAKTGPELLKAGIEEFIDQAQAPGRKFVLIGQVPSGQADPVPCLLASSAGIFRRNCEDIGPSMWRIREWLHKPIHEVFRQIASERQDVQLVLPAEKLCANGSCITIMDGQPLYRDGNHIRRNLPMHVRKDFAAPIGLTREILGR